jgi:hypothetical protein
MAGLDPGEFGRGAAAREDARRDREWEMLESLLGAGWSAGTVAEARRLHAALSEALGRVSGVPCNETALGLVGEARGVAMADWWAAAHGLDDRTHRLLRECASAVAAMALCDGFVLGRDALVEAPRATPAVRSSSPTRQPDLVSAR